MVKSWLVQDQTVLGKDYSNLLIADSLLKTIWFINAPCYGNEALASPKANVKKSLYGSKQALRQWNHKLSEAVNEDGFKQSKNDHSLFFKDNEKFSLFLLVDVDDIVITKVLETNSGLCLSQRKCCLELLHEFGLLACRLVMTPLPKNIVLAHKETEVDKCLVKTNYQKLVGKLIHLTLTRSDISYDVHYLSQHMHSSLKSHFDIALRLLKYLKLAPRNDLQLKQRSMAAAKYEIMWIVKIMKDLNVDNLNPVDLYCDEKSAIQNAANPIMHEKTKYFEIDMHLVREKVASGLIKTLKVESKDNVADILTKALGSFQQGSKVKIWNIVPSALMACQPVAQRARGCPDFGDFVLSDLLLPDTCGNFNKGMYMILEHFGTLQKRFRLKDKQKQILPF
ncbi:ribonuclease H-like domain-containing protein [Tanacetum coccineum]